ncbi:hypothetical protein [Chromobacterium haemolyticum]|uniref:hypothetical protein n=1 Tax=Chromobacterium haemolyticum TaxID=394935 RepID=UPI00113205F6|nr:hypothetical protein [Chromobacterium haemolyticum]
MKIMQRVPHKTPIRILRDAFTTYRQRSEKSWEAVAEEFVERFDAMGLAHVLPFEFQRPGAGKDTARVMRTNGQRLNRWLEVETKATSQLPVELMQVALQVLPVDLRLLAMTEIARPVGLDVALSKTQEASSSHVELLTSLIKETGEGLTAFSMTVERPTLERLESALIELRESEAAHQEAIAAVLGCIAEETEKCRPASFKSAG